MKLKLKPISIEIFEVLQTIVNRKLTIERPKRPKRPWEFLMNLTSFFHSSNSGSNAFFRIRPFFEVQLAQPLISKVKKQEIGG